MSRNNKHYILLKSFLSNYSETRSLEFRQYSPFHMRITDEGFTTIDFWTTARYYILKTEYYKLTENKIVERQGEKGTIPVDRNELFDWLDRLFFPESCL